MLYFEDFSVGRVFQLGPIGVTRSDMIAFARAFDPQDIHLSTVVAIERGFSDIIASGWHTAALFMRMQCEGFLTQSSCIVSPGIDSLRWLHPVYADDILSAAVTVVSSRISVSKPDRGIVLSHASITNASGTEVMTMETTALYGRRCPVRSVGP